MNFDGCTPQAIPRWGSLVQWDSPVQLPLGLARIVRNTRYTQNSQGTRWGFTNRIKFGAQNSRVASLAFLRYLSADNLGTEIIEMMAYTQTDGNIWSALPFTQSTVAQLSNNAFHTLTGYGAFPGLNPVLTQAFNRGYAALGDLTKGVKSPLVHDPSMGTLDQASDNPFGAPWNPNKLYRVGHMVSPSTFQTNGLPASQGVWVAANTGHLYRCTQNGTSDPNTQPAWPTATNGTIGDGTTAWEEYTPTAGSGLPDPSAPSYIGSSADPSSPILNGMQVYFALTYVNAAGGESINSLTDAQGILDTSKVFIFTNNLGGPADVEIQMPAIPAALAAGGPLGANGAVSYNVYAYVVSGNPGPAQLVDPSFYAQFGSNIAPGATVTLSAFPSGKALPTVNTANIADVGNVDVGQRWMVVFYETQTEYETGFGATSPVLVNVTQSGLKLLAQSIPIGPYNTIARICAFTVAGASSAGPYFYVDADDTESPGFNQPDIAITSTRINDNVTTSAQFNITDTYLPGASDVTNYFNRIEIPPCSDIHFVKTLSQVIYTGCAGYPSGFLVSDFEDPEAIRVPGSVIQCSESDGDRTVCVRSVRDNQVGMKENSGHAIIANSGDPSTWAVNELWTGSGPAGAKAVAVGVEDTAEFLIYAHHTGPYRYTGGSPMLIGREIGAAISLKLQGLWKRINWAYGYKIVTTIDSERRDVRFAVPMDGATDINQTIVVNYSSGWDDPTVFTLRGGQQPNTTSGRKWSLDDWAPLDSVYIPQRYQTTPSPDVDLNSQLVVGMPDGAVYTLTEGQLYDEDYNGNQVGYFSQWLGVPGPNPALAIYALEGCTISGTGNGPMNIYAVDDKGVTSKTFTMPTRQAVMSATEQQFDFGAVAIQGCRWGLGMDNGGVAGNGYEIHQGILWVKKLYGARVG